MFESISRSFGIVKKSFGVLMQEKKLMLFPLVSTIALIAVLVSFIVPAVFIQDDVLFFMLLFGFYFVSYFVITFFNSALIHAANEKLEGRAVSLMASVSFASSKVANIAVWSLISATVGIIMSMLRSISNRNNGGIGALIAGLVASVMGMAWSFATFFVVPVMIFENVDPLTAIKRSVDLIKKSWGEQVIGGLMVGGVFMILYVIGVVLVVGGILSPPLLLVLVTAGIMLMFLTFIAQGAIEGIFLAELYRYSTTGQAAIFKEEIEQAKAAAPQKDPVQPPLQ